MGIISQALRSGIRQPRLSDGETPAPRDQASVSSAQPFLLLGGGFQAASFDAQRGYIYWPQVDTRRQITSWTRYEVARRIQFLYAHFGFIRRLVNGMARMLGYLTPQPDTSDEEWNEMAFESFMSIAGSAQLWDRAGKFDFFEGQMQDNISIFRDADCVALKTLSPGGRARLAYYEAHQLANPDGSGVEWVDGVKVGAGSNHVAYGLRDGEDPTSIVEVEAWKCIYFGNFENRGQVRPLSILAAAVLNMTDVVETRGFTKHAIKETSRFGTVVEQEAGATVTGMGGLAGPIVQAQVKTPDGGYQNFNYEVVMQGAQTPNLVPGQKVKVIADDRPSPNKQAFEEALLRDCCYTADLNYERICDLSAAKGPGIRMLNADDKRWVAIRHHKQAKRCHAQVVYTLAVEMAAKRLREPKLKPNEMWFNKFLYIGLPFPDIDGGRTAQATVSYLQAGLTNWLQESKIYGGGFWKRNIRQSIREVVFAHQCCREESANAQLEDGLVTPEKVFPERFAAKLTLPLPDGATPTDAKSSSVLPDDDPPEDEPTTE